MSDIVVMAEALARRIHAGQMRKYHVPEQPYDVHLERFADKVRHYFPEGNYRWMIAAAWLHDSVEDHPDKISFQDISDEFGAQVSRTVQSLTSWTKRNHKLLDGFNRAERKAIDQAMLSEESRDVRWLKLLDRIDNLEDMLTTLDHPECRTFAPVYCAESQRLVRLLTWSPMFPLDIELRDKARDLCVQIYEKLGLIRRETPEKTP